MWCFYTTRYFFPYIRFVILKIPSFDGCHRFLQRYDGVVSTYTAVSHQQAMGEKTQKSGVKRLGVISRRLEFYPGGSCENLFY